MHPTFNKHYSKLTEFLQVTDNDNSSRMDTAVEASFWCWSRKDYNEDFLQNVSISTAALSKCNAQKIVPSKAFPPFYVIKCAKLSPDLISFLSTIKICMCALQQSRAAVVVQCQPPLCCHRRRRIKRL